MIATLDAPGAGLRAVLSHELRNPLAAAATNLAVAAEMTDPDDPRAAFLARTADELRRIEALLDAWLAPRRPGGLVHGDCCIDALLAALAERHRGRPVSVAVTAAGDAVVRGDRALLGRVLDNLVENALAAAATTVHVTATATATHVAIAVHDDGHGVPVELRGRIFEPRVSGRGSSGLGLAVAREIATAHGGRIWLDATAADTCFRIALPRSGAA